MPHNPLSIEVFQVLDAIERRGSFSKAAEELNKATSALSYTVQKLEEQLDLSVFQRQGRRSVLTPAGRLILDEGRQILQATQLIADKAHELATGWEHEIRIALDSMLNYQVFFEALGDFLEQNPNLELDISECILNGGWEALEHDRVDLVVGVGGPVPAHKGFRSVTLPSTKLVPVIAAKHPLSDLAQDRKALEEQLHTFRRVVSHDTATTSIVKNAGLSLGKKVIYTQTIDQKITAQLAGLGIGHLPPHRIQNYLDTGELIPLNIDAAQHETFIAWKAANKGKGLSALIKLLEVQDWSASA